MDPLPFFFAERGRAPDRYPGAFGVEAAPQPIGAALRVVRISKKVE
ncbi:MAG: hypothetical protein KDB25_04860 [Leucobacter sp.]|nr:hypothetical protein [Leucobacter sp.]